MGPPTKLWGYFKKSHPAHNPKDPIPTFDQLPQLETEIEVVEKRNDRKLGTATIKTKEQRLHRLHPGLYNKGDNVLDAEDYDWLIMDGHDGDGRYPRPNSQAKLPTHHYPKPNPDQRPKTVPDKYSFQTQFPKFEDVKSDMHHSASLLKQYNERIKTAEDREKRSRASRMTASMNSSQQAALSASSFFPSQTSFNGTSDDFVTIRPQTAPEFVKPHTVNKHIDTGNQSSLTKWMEVDEEKQDEKSFPNTTTMQLQELQNTHHGSLSVAEESKSTFSQSRPTTGSRFSKENMHIPEIIEPDRVKDKIGLDGVPVLTAEYDQDLLELEKMTTLRMHGKDSVLNMRSHILYPIDAISQKRVPVSHIESVRFRSTRPFGYAMEIKAKKRRDAKEKVREFIRSNTTGANKTRAKSSSKNNTSSSTGPDNSMTRCQTAPTITTTTSPVKGTTLLLRSASSSSGTGLLQGTVPEGAASPLTSTTPLKLSRPTSKYSGSKRLPPPTAFNPTNKVEEFYSLSVDSFDVNDFGNIYEKNLHEVMMSFDEEDENQKDQDIHALVLRSIPETEKKERPSTIINRSLNLGTVTSTVNSMSISRPMSARRHKQSTPFVEDIPFNVDILRASLLEGEEEQKKKSLTLSLPNTNALEALVANADEPFQAVDHRSLAHTPEKLQLLRPHTPQTISKSMFGTLQPARSSSVLLGGQVLSPTTPPTPSTAPGTDTGLSRAGSNSYMLMRINPVKPPTTTTTNTNTTLTADSVTGSPNYKPSSPQKLSQSPSKSSSFNNVFIPPVAFSFDKEGHIEDIHFKSQIPKPRPSSADRLHHKKRTMTAEEEAERHRMILEEQARKASLQSNRKDLLNLHMIDEIDERNERHALMDLFRQCGGKHWHRKDNWCTDRPVREWYGVRVTVEGYVFEVHLSNNNLTGPFPDMLCDFSKIEVIQLDNNQLTGHLPDYCLQNCRSLRVLSARNNRLIGLIPFDLLTDLIFLQECWLGQNSFEGHIQLGVCKLHALTHLCLKENQLTGEIPSQLSKLKHLKYLSLSKNKLTGEIPKSFISLHQLETLSLFSNRLSGVVPEWIFSIPTLEDIELFDNPELIIPPKLPISVK